MKRVKRKSMLIHTSCFIIARKVDWNLIFLVKGVGPVRANFVCDGKKERVQAAQGALCCESEDEQRRVAVGPVGWVWQGRSRVSTRWYRGWIQKEWNNGLGCGQLAAFQPILSRLDAGVYYVYHSTRLIFVPSPSNRSDASHSKSYFPVSCPYGQGEGW